MKFLENLRIGVKKKSEKAKLLRLIGGEKPGMEDIVT